MADASSAAKWVYLNNIKRAKGNTGSKVLDTITIPIPIILL